VVEGGADVHDVLLMLTTFFIIVLVVFGVLVLVCALGVLRSGFCALSGAAAAWSGDIFNLGSKARHREDCMAPKR